jgi:3'(2'), 5'-bisphosphate nucleotidase
MDEGSRRWDGRALDVLVDLALRAGSVLLELSRAELVVREKSDHSPVTIADEQAEAVILAGLAAAFPGIPVASEEAVGAGILPPGAATLFLVDPLDGTREFLRDSGEYTVNIGLVEQGRPVLGVVHAPALGEIYWGAERAGAWRAGVQDGRLSARQPIAVRRPRADGLMVLASRSHLTPETEAFMRRFPIADRVAAGSSLKFCRVAEGAADLYPRLGRTMEWDTAAGDAILRAAGGSVSTLDRAPLAYNKRNQSDDVDFANPWFVAAGDFDPFAEDSHQE